ncbi:MAG: alpha/beta hydrolase [Anaerolineae bacterium]|nr:alpha/beta hydrolase [Anaerolineae bacterium]
MKPVVRGLLIGIGILILLVVVGPLVIPVPPLNNVVPAATLADPDSQFTEVAGIEIHFKQSGEGDPTFLLLHGFGASVFSWRSVLDPLGKMGTAIAYDRPAFGLTERPLAWEGANPYSTGVQPDIAVGLLDFLGREQAILVGNSAGGTTAVYTALRYPERVKALVLISPAIYTGGGAPDFVRPLLKTPQLQRLGPLVSRMFLSNGRTFLETAWHDPGKLTPEIVAGYEIPTQVENWDVALWQMTLATEYPDLVARLDELELPVLVITGDDDRIVPTEDSVRLASALPNADLLVIPECGHLAQEECSEPVMEAIRDFVGGLP